MQAIGRPFRGTPLGRGNSSSALLRRAIPRTRSYQSAGARWATRAGAAPSEGGGAGDRSSEGRRGGPPRDREYKLRRGQRAWDPKDSPLRDGNRDRLMGLLTERAARTLAYYLMETNLSLYNWWMAYLDANPPAPGGRPGEHKWEEARGDAFLLKLLSTPASEVAWAPNRPEVFNIVKHMDVNPRDMATRTMDVRAVVAKEFAKDLADVSGKENLVLLRETLMGSLNASVDEDMPLARTGGPVPPLAEHVAKGKGQYHKAKRRKGRPAWERSPDDTPLRDGNRDRLVGLLTERATRTLAFQLVAEGALPAYRWWLAFLRANPTPRKGDWDEICGDAFLRKLLAMPGPDDEDMDVKPRELATRVMDIRSELAHEFVADLAAVGEENLLLLRAALEGSLGASSEGIEEEGEGGET